MEPKPRPESAPDVTPFNGSEGGIITEPVAATPISPPASPQHLSPSPAPTPPTPPPEDPVAAAVDWIRQNPGPIGIGLVVLGLFFLLVQATTFGLLLLLVGVVVAALGFRGGGVLRRQQVIERWDTLLDGAQGHGARVVGTTVSELGRMQLPAVRWAQAALSPGVLRGLIGDTRSFLVVNHTANPRLKTYRMYVNVRDYGTNLQTSWFLTFQPPFWKRMRNTYTPSLNLGLDLFDEQDLRAYVTAVHHAFLAAVVELLASQGKDASSLNRTSRGFLGIS